MQIWFVDYDTMSKLILFVLSLFLFSLPKMTKPQDSKLQKTESQPKSSILSTKKPGLKTQ